MSDDELEIDDVFDEDEVFVPYDITSYPSDLTLQVISDMWHAGDITVPDFQRNFVWTIQQSSLLIDSFLMGLPVPQTFFYVDEKSNKSIVIDGLQRILSVVYYLEGFFGSEHHGKRQIFKLTGLDRASPFHGKKFVDLEETHQRKLKTSVLRAINIRQIKPTGEQTSKYHIFERLNTGGTPLKPQEIRNCVFSGPFVSLLRELNEDRNWRKILGKKAYDKHQKDVELILRIFSLSEDWGGYEKPMKEYLNIAMLKNKDAQSKRVVRFAKKFPVACELIVKLFGEKPFHIRGPLNTSAMDSIFCTILDNLDQLAPNLKESYQKLALNEEYKGATYYGTSDASVLKRRFELANEYLVRR